LHPLSHINAYEELKLTFTEKVVQISEKVAQSPKEDVQMSEKDV
jgi:hypothetical protein